MKQKELIKLFSNSGWWILREGRNHIIMTNAKTLSRCRATEK